MDKNFSKYLLKNPLDPLLKKIFFSGLIDFEDFSKVINSFSVYIARSLKLISNDIDTFKAQVINHFVTFKKLFSNTLNFLQELKSYLDKKYTNIKALYGIFILIVDLFKLVRDLIMILFLGLYVLYKTNAKSLLYTFTAKELTSLGVNSNSFYRLDAKLISKINIEIDIVELFKEFMILFMFSHQELSSKISIEKTNSLNIESQLKTSIASYHSNMNYILNSLSSTSIEVLNSTYIGEQVIDLNSDSLITPQLIFKNIESLYSEYEDTSSAKQIMDKIYG